MNNIYLDDACPIFWVYSFAVRIKFNQQKTVCICKTFLFVLDIDEVHEKCELFECLANSISQFKVTFEQNFIRIIQKLF